MSFTTPIGLLALLAVPAVVALHLFRRRFVERRVGGLFLFSPDALRATAGRKRSRLLRSASLWLEVAAALCAALWLGGLRFGASGDAPHFVVVLDDSASMAAEDGADGVASSAAERARAAVRARAELLPATATVTLIRSGARPEILLGPRSPIGALAGSLDSWRPWRPRHDLGPTFDLAIELGGDDARCVLVTDDQVELDVPDLFAVEAVGREADNVAIVHARRERGDGGGTARLRVDVRAFTRSPVATELIVERVEAGGAVVEIARRPLEVDPAVPSLGVTLEAPLGAAHADAALVVRLPGDALAADNAITLFAPQTRVVDVAVRSDRTSGAGEPVEGVLGEPARIALELARVLRAVPGVRIVEDAAKAQLVVGRDPDGQRHELLFAAADDGGERDAWIGPFWIDRRSELTEGLTLDGVVWSAGRGAPLPGVPLVLAGDRPLLTREGRGERIRLWLDLDPTRSNFSTSPDWPILLTNLTAAVRAVAPGVEATAVPVGGIVRWRPPLELDGEDRRARLHDPDGTLRPGRGLRVVTWDARRPGLHRIVGVGDDVERARVSVYFRDAHESDLRQRASRVVERSPAPIVAGRPATPSAAVVVERRILGILLLAFVLLDWWVLRRGARPAPAVEVRP